MIREMYNKLFGSKFSIAIITLLGSIIDMMIVGHFYGSIAMAAIGISTPLIALLCLMANIVNAGCETVCSREIGKSNIDKANSLLGISTIVGVAVLTLAVVVICIFSKDIGILLGASDNEELLHNVQDFLLAANLSTPTCVVNANLIYLLQLNNKGWATPIANIIFVITNLSLDLANVFFFNMGIFGMGLATSCAYVVYMITLYLLYKSTKTVVHFSFKNMQIKDMTQIIKYGGNRFIVSGSTNILNLLINYLLLNVVGPIGVAAFSVMNSLMSILLSVGNALSYSTNMIASLMYGERNVKELKSVIKNFMYKSVLYNLAITIGVLIFANFIVGFYFENADETYYLTVNMVRIVSFGLVFYSIGFCFMMFFVATKNRFLSYVFILSQNLLIFVFFAVLVKVTGAVSVAIAYVATFVFVNILIVVVCSVKSKSSPFKASTYLLLPNNFSVDESNILNYAVHRTKDLDNIQKVADEFCRAHDAADNIRKTIIFIVTEIERHTRNFGIKDLLLIKNVFLRIVRTEDGWIVCLRDDCREFNPKQYIEDPYEETPEFKASLQLARKTVTSYNYKHLMGFNISTVTF